MFGFLLYMKVASEVPKITSFSQVFLTLLVFKILFPTPPPPLPYFQILLLFWNFCFLLSGTFRNKSQILQMKFPPGCQSHPKKGRRKTKKQQQQLKSPAKATKTHAKIKKTKTLETEFRTFKWEYSHLIIEVCTLKFSSHSSMNHSSPF